MTAPTAMTIPAMTALEAVATPIMNDWEVRRSEHVCARLVQRPTDGMHKAIEQSDESAEEALQGTVELLQPELGTQVVVEQLLVAAGHVTLAAVQPPDPHLKVEQESPRPQRLS